MPPRSSHLQVHNCSRFLQGSKPSLGLLSARNSKVGPDKLEATKKAPFIFNPNVEAAQSKQQGITFAAVGLGLVFFIFILIYGTRQQVCARVCPRVLQPLPLPTTVGAGGCSMVWPPQFGDWCGVLCWPCSKQSAGLSRPGVLIVAAPGPVAQVL